VDADDDDGHFEKFFLTGTKAVGAAAVVSVEPVAYHLMEEAGPRRTVELIYKGFSPLDNCLHVDGYGYVDGVRDRLTAAISLNDQDYGLTADGSPSSFRKANQAPLTLPSLAKVSRW
jgi:hypothetical protein